MVLISTSDMQENMHVEVHKAINEKTISPFHVSTKIIPVRYKQFYLQASTTSCYHSLIKIPVQEHTRLYSHTYIHVVIIFDILLKQHALYL